MKKRITILAVLASFAGLTGCISNEKHTSMTAPKPYPLGDKCVVSGHKIEGKGVTFVTNGREVRLCCEDCRAEFDKNPAKFLAKLN